MIYEHCMLDLETLGNSAGGVVLQIGAVCFNMMGGHHEDTFLRNVDIQSCLNRGLFVEGGNVEFWLRQEKDAQKSLFLPVPIPVNHAIEDFHKWWVHHDPVFLWSNGSDYDIPIFLEAWTRSVAAKPPWPYKNHRCYRTMLWYARHEGWKKPGRPEDMPKHQADMDALYQAYCLQSAITYLKKGTQ